MIGTLNAEVAAMELRQSTLGHRLQQEHQRHPSHRLTRPLLVSTVPHERCSLDYWTLIHNLGRASFQKFQVLRLTLCLPSSGRRKHHAALTRRRSVQEKELNAM